MQWVTQVSLLQCLCQAMQVDHDLTERVSAEKKFLRDPSNPPSVEAIAANEAVLGHFLVPAHITGWKLNRVGFVEWVLWKVMKKCGVPWSIALGKDWLVHRTWCLYLTCCLMQGSAD